MRSLTLTAAALLVSTAATAQSVRALRTGTRALLARADEIRLARSAAPPAVSARARVLVLTDAGYVVADSGSSDVTCMVSRSWPGSLEPECFDAEAATSILPMEVRRIELAHRGVAADSIERDIERGLSTGRFRPPARPALAYMMSAGQVLFNDDGKRVGPWRPHVMVYYPYLTSRALGLPAQPEMKVGMVTDEGTPLANLTLLMTDFVPVATAATP